MDWNGGTHAILGNWVLIAVIAYFCHAVNVILDKVLLGEKNISSPASYVFYGGLWGILALLLVPFAGHTYAVSEFFTPSAFFIFLAFAAGAFSIIALFAFYTAIKTGEASWVATVMGGVSPVFVLVLSSLFFGSFLALREYESFVLFVVGSVIISYHGHHDEGNPILRKNTRWIIVAALFFSLTYVFEKILFNHGTFLQGFVWSRLGAFVAVFFLLIFPAIRKEIFSWSPRSSGRTSSLFIVNKFVGALGFFFLSYAIKVAHTLQVSIINAMQGLEYALVFVIAVALSVWQPQILKERISAFVILRKVSAIAFISAGLFLLT